MSTNTVYPLARGDVRRIDLTTLATILDALAHLTGSPVAIADVLEHRSWRGADAVEALADEAARVTPASGGVGRPAGSPLLPSDADVGGAVVENRDARAWAGPPADAEPDGGDDDLAWLERLLP